MQNYWILWNNPLQSVKAALQQRNLLKDFHRSRSCIVTSDAQHERKSKFNTQHREKRIEINPDYRSRRQAYALHFRFVHLPARVVSARPRNCRKICEPPRQNLSAARKLNLLRRHEVKFTSAASKDLRAPVIESRVLLHVAVCTFSRVILLPYKTIPFWARCTRDCGNASFFASLRWFFRMKRKEENGE